ncbi:MAG: sodium:proton antiporter, partial [Polyangiaceae bacterium]
ARWLKVPYTSALVVAGLIIGAGKWVPAPHLSKDLLFTVFLPGLLFEAAFHLNAKHFWANKWAVSGLAVPGVVLAIGVTAFLLVPFVRGFALERGFRLIDGLVFGGIVAATDPIAVVALFKSLGTPKRLGVLVEGESLLNDGTAVVLFGVILNLASGAPVTIADVALDFFRTCGLGVVIGTALGYAGSKVIRLVDDPMIEITATVVVAWGSFALAEQVQASGVLATVSAGLLCGNYGARTGMSPTTKIAVATFWGYLAFALNSIVFLLIGFEVQLRGVLAAWQTVILAWLATTAARAIVVAAVTLALRRSRERLPKWWGVVMSWAGIRGGLSMVLVLALPLTFPHRQFLIDVVFGVVVLSILLQGSTLAPLLRHFKINSEDAARFEYQAARVDQLAAQAALEELTAIEGTHTSAANIVQNIRAEYRSRLADAEGRLRTLHLADSVLADEELHRIHYRLIMVEKERVLDAIRHGAASEETAAKLLAALDARLVQLEQRAES